MAYQRFSSVSLTSVPRGFVASFLLVALVGLSDALFLTMRHYEGLPPSCTLTEGCELVLTSSYAVFLHVPVALWGTFYYAALVLGALLYIVRGESRPFLAALGLTAFGFIASLWLLFLQAFILKAFCSYCLLSAAVATVLFLLALAMFRIITVPAP